MGLFGHGGWLSKAGHAIEKGVSELGKALGGGESYYVGYNSNSGPIVMTGPTADQIMQNGGASGSVGSEIEHPSGAGTIQEIENRNNQGYVYNNIGKNPNTYTGNVAKTANSIKQGGMTKDDVIAYNQKHPNETAGTNGSMETSLNSNTATKRY